MWKLLGIAILLVVSLTNVCNGQLITVRRTSTVGNPIYYTVEYTPTTSGHHTIAIVQAVSLEQQVITTGYNTVARGGSFTIKLGNLSTPPLPFDVDVSMLKHALDTSMGTVSTFNVKKLDYGLFNFKYEITFETLMGDVPSFVVDTTNLIGNTNDWDVTTLSDGMFKHIKLDDDNPTNEIQSIKVQVVDSSSLVGATWSLSFNGQVTTPIAWDANADEVKQKLETLSTVGDIVVSLNVDEVTNERDYTITFDPYQGKSSNSLTNFGNLPLIGVSNVDDSIITVTSGAISDGASPFRVLVSPSEATSANTTAHDYQDEHGLSTGIYKTDAHFIIQSIDEYSNEIQDGPLREVQIIETSSSSNIGGHFELSLFGNTTRLQSNASPMQLEKALQSIPGVGSVSVSSNSVKDLVVGKTVAVTKGLDTIVPSEELVEFIVEDWIRIGDQDEGQLFSITDIADVSPFTITLSSPYIGETDDATNIYQHGSSHSNRNGYQYIVSFDSILGDMPSLGVDGSLLEGDDATIEVTSCDWNIRQTLHATGDGSFYLVYGSEETRLLSVDATAQELEDVILGDISLIHDVSVSQQGSKSWAIHLKSFDGEAQQVFAEGHLLTSGSISVSQVCPVASHQTIYSATSVAGRRGENYIVTLDDESSIVHGTVQHIEDGRYLATYEAPRVGTYSLSIENAHGGGLIGEYFNNRWLYNEPASTRVDSQIDFHFGDDLVTTSGKDFVSVRWTGYIKPAFDEVYSFTVRVNDALKLWIGDELLIDEYENEVDEASSDKYTVFSTTTNEALKADQLVPIKIEYRENRGLAMIQLYWESISQPFAIIDQPRLFHSSTPIHGSPFEVIPSAIEPTEPTNCSVEIAAWDQLEVSWSAPNDDGGSNITKYLVESWDASITGEPTTTSQEIVVDDDTDSTFHHLITDLSQPSSVLDGFGVRVSASNDEGYGIPCQSIFLKPFGEPSPPKVVELVRVANDPSSLALHWTSVSSPDDKSSIVTHYLVEVSSQDSFSSIELSTMLSADLVSSDRLSSYSNVDETWNYYLIDDGMNPGKEYLFRISAVNEAGTGPSARSTPLSLAPGGKPSDLDDVTLSTIDTDDTITVGDSSSTLRLSWRSPTTDNGFAVDKYLVESWLTDGTNEVQELSLQSITGELTRGTFTLGYGNDKTDSLSVDSTAEDVQSALESLSSIRSVRVWRSGVNPDYQWSITFMAGESDLLVVEDETALTDDSGSIPTMQINVLTEAVAPIGYNTEIVTVEEPLQEHYELILSDLTPGLPYYVRVSAAANELGYSPPKSSIPLQLAPPIQKPSSPTNVILSVASSQSLEVTFTKPDSDGGDTITLYRIEWDTNENFGSDDLSSYSFVSPKDGVGCVPCTHQINGLIKGQQYFIRVFAYNSHGYSIESGLPSPPSAIPKTSPEPPEVVNISPQSDTSVRVQFPRSPDDGGAQVTRYLIEYNAQGYHSGHAMNADHTALLYSSYTVQTITISADEDDISGVFRLALEGHSTDAISATSSANDMKLALESLPTVGDVLVSRETTTNGHTWAITFLSNHENIDNYGPIDLLTVSIDPAALPPAFVTDISLGTNSQLVVNEEVTAYKGYELQTLTSQCNTQTGVLSGHFALSLDGARTNDISFDVSPLDLQHELEMIESIGTVQVTRRHVHDSINSFEMTIIFLDRLGNVPMLEVDDSLTCSDGSGSPLIYIVETTQGVLPNMNGPYSGEVELNALDYDENSDIVHVVDGLQRNMPYHFQVSAWNGAGDTYGRSQYSIPPLMIPVDPPDSVRLVEMKPIDDSTLLINWDASLTKGGSHMIKKFKVALNSTEAQYGDEEVFDVTSTPEIQEILIESSAMDMGGFIKVQFMGESSTNILVESTEDEIKQALEGISTIDQVSVSILPYTQDNMSSFGKKWLVTFVSQTENLPSLLVDTGSGPASTIATGGTLLGSSSVVRVETVADGGLPWSFITPLTLSSDEMYTCRVWAFNGHSWSEPASSRHAVSPLKSAPSEPRDVRVNVLSDTEIGVSWTEPLYSGGDDVASYRIEWDSDLMFDHSATTVSAHLGEDYYYVLGSLDPNDSYYVRVMAKSAKGFSEPNMAVPLLSDTQTIDISLESSGVVDYTEEFVIEYTTTDGFTRSTGPLSIYATSQEVENELNSIGDVGAVSVDREDRSSSYDSSGIETDAFSILYRLTFVGVDDEVTLNVDETSLGSISVTVETEV